MYWLGDCGREKINHTTVLSRNVIILWHRGKRSMCVLVISDLVGESEKVAPGLEATDSLTPGSTSAEPILHRTTTGEEQKLSRRPSKKLLANGLLLLGGVVCLSCGHSSLGAKVAMAYVLTKLNKRGASSSQSGNIAGS